VLWVLLKKLENWQRDKFSKKVKYLTINQYMVIIIDNN